MSAQPWPVESASPSPSSECSPYTIPLGPWRRSRSPVTELIVLIGLFIVNSTFELNLTENAVFEPACIEGSSGIIHGGSGENSTITDLRDPFYSSTAPQIYAIATATVISYFLVILIFITPRTFFVGGPGGGARFLTRTGLSGNSSVIGVGRRPLLQKIAAITVAISMTMATADTFKVAKAQYEDGFMNSEELTTRVIGGLEIRIAQVISDTFLWLAQVQTLIRLFPRHKEKVTIKWLGFALILFDVIFSSLNNFLGTGTNPRPLRSRDAIPALSYLFELAIGFIYASSIIYYSISKYRFAFYHAKMRNICLVALLSITSVLIPVVFFVIDVSFPDIAAWGFYIRWVGAAAASVVVWEWVERIEALERDERKDGILGREIYDGDEMLDVTTANGVDWRRGRPRSNSARSDEKGDVPASRGSWGGKRRTLRSRIPFQNSKKKDHSAKSTLVDPEAMPSTTDHDLSRPAPPAAVATPVSRADTTSAASTVYAVRYHNSQSTSPQALENGTFGPVVPKEVSNVLTLNDPVAKRRNKEKHDSEKAHSHAVDQKKPFSRPLWTAVSNPFKRKRASPPAEVAGAQRLNENASQRWPAALVNPEERNLRSKMDAFTTIQREKLRARRQAGRVNAPLPVTIIPAQPRGARTLSPDDLAGAAGVLSTDSDGGPPHTVVRSSGRHETMNVTVVPAPIRGQRTWSPEDMHHHHQEAQLADAAHNISPRQQEEPSDRELFTTGDQLSDEAPKAVDLESSFESVCPRVDGQHEPALSRVIATTDRPDAPHQQTSLSNQCNCPSPPTEADVSLDRNVQDVSSSPEKRHDPVCHFEALSEDDRAPPDDGQ
jgi:PalH/RIM21